MASPNISYIRLLQAIESFSSAHMQIQRFGSDFPGQMPNFATADGKYPILFVSPDNSIFNQNTTTFRIVVYCFDIIQKDRENINTILSDTNQIVNDLDRWFRDGDISGIDLLESSTATPINNRLLDYAAGWEMSMTFDVSTYGLCEIPFDGAPVVTMEVCDVIYAQYLTCDSLEDCEIIQEIEDSIRELYQTDISLQEQIDNIVLTPGPTGATGPQGITGPTGANGTIGATGATGPSLWGGIQGNISDQTDLVLFVGTSSTGLEAINEGNGVGWRLKGRNPAQYGNIGLNAVDLSISDANSSSRGATGTQSFAAGYRSTASGNRSIALLGSSSGDRSISLGGSSTGTNSVSIGGSSTSTRSVSIGSGLASAEDSVAIGGFAYGVASLAVLGNSYGTFSIALGAGNNSIGDYSLTGGYFNKANSYSEVALGTYTEDIAGSATSFVLTDAIFKVGIGTDILNAKDAFRIYKNGSFYMAGVTQSDITNAVDGSYIYNINTKRINVNNGSTWKQVAYLEDGVIGATGSTGATGATGPSVWGGITGTLSSQVDLQNALNIAASQSSVWKKSDLTTNANTPSETAYRTGTINLVGFGKYYAASSTATASDGFSFGNIGTVTVNPFLSMLSTSANGTSGPNNIIGNLAGATLSVPQMNFSIIKDTGYFGWNEANRTLFRFSDGYLSPTPKLDIGSDFIRFYSYTASRNDISTASASNFLYTDINGGLKSAPLSTIIGTTGATGPSGFTFSTKTSSYNMLSTDDIIYANGNNITIALPSATASQSKRYTVKNIGTGSVTLFATASQTIGGSNNLALTYNRPTVEVASDGTTWRIVSNQKNNSPYLVSTASYTTGAGTALRNLFNTPNSVMVEPYSLYTFRCNFTTEAGVGANAFQFGFGGSATIDNISYAAISAKGSSFVSVAAQYQTYGTTSSATSLMSSAAGAFFSSSINGIIQTGANGGYLIPQIASVSSATMLVGTASMFIIDKLGSANANGSPDTL